MTNYRVQIENLEYKYKLQNINAKSQNEKKNQSTQMNIRSNIATFDMTLKLCFEII